ncbi:SS18-like protein 2 isoform X2 [Lepus europaeus]|uniref:SS18-like protein 2 isoform X2 n=1 Tax=Lepus europaeus TaxID=9983 RepID=UPI002B460967|nr:SS18-like protein 2 isoform X2 [Lepus europaeus]
MSSHCSPACGNFRSSSSSTLFYLSAPSGLDILQRLPGMSVAFVPDWLRGSAEVNQETIQRLLEENDQLIRCIVEYQNKGRANECVHYHCRCQPSRYFKSRIIFHLAVVKRN